MQKNTPFSKDKNAVHHHATPPSRHPPITPLSHKIIPPIKSCQGKSTIQQNMPFFQDANLFKIHGGKPSPTHERTPPQTNPSPPNDKTTPSPHIPHASPTHRTRPAPYPVPQNTKRPRAPTSPLINAALTLSKHAIPNFPYLLQPTQPRIHRTHEPQHEHHAPPACQPRAHSAHGATKSARQPCTLSPCAPHHSEIALFIHGRGQHF